MMKNDPTQKGIRIEITLKNSMTLTLNMLAKYNVIQ